MTGATTVEPTLESSARAAESSRLTREGCLRCVAAVYRDDGQWTGGRVEQVEAHGPEQEVGETLGAAASHDNQLSVPSLLEEQVDRVPHSRHELDAYGAEVLAPWL